MRFLKLCFKVIPSTFVDFYTLSWRALFNVAVEEDGSESVRPGVFIMLLASFIRASHRIFLLFSDTACSIGFMALLCFGVSLSIIFPFLIFVWAPFTAWRVLRYEKEIALRYEEWERS